MNEEEGTGYLPPCSRTPHTRTVLGGRAQLRAGSPVPSGGRGRANHAVPLEKVKQKEDTALRLLDYLTSQEKRAAKMKCTFSCGRLRPNGAEMDLKIGKVGMSQ